uniref:Uncharacterized protein n=1 Tax=Arundo donax TaxID=35708 RepID=A0A0A9TE55_ARUDO
MWLPDYDIILPRKAGWDDGNG